MGVGAVPFSMRHETKAAMTESNAHIQAIAAKPALLASCHTDRTARSGRFSGKRPKASPVCDPPAALNTTVISPPSAAVAINPAMRATVLLTADNAAKVGDFGLVKLLADENDVQHVSKMVCSQACTRVYAFNCTQAIS